MKNPCCKFYKVINDREVVVEHKHPGWRKGYPWFYYQETGDKVVNGASMKLKVALNEKLPKASKTYVHDMNFYLVKYSLEGKYINMEPLETQL